MHGRGAREMAVVLRVAEGSNSENELCADTEHLDHFDILENVLKGDGDDHIKGAQVERGRADVNLTDCDVDRMRRGAFNSSI